MPAGTFRKKIVFGHKKSVPQNGGTPLRINLFRLLVNNSKKLYFKYQN